MKKFILLLLLLPVFGFSQVDIVKWVGTTDLKPTLLNDYISAENFTGAGITGPTASYDGIAGTNWPTANARDTNKYFQIAVNQTLDGTYRLNQINFNYKGNCRAYEVWYSKNQDFSGATRITINSSANFNNNSIIADITGQNILVTGGQTLYIRFYAYNGGGEFKVMNNITLRGTVTAPQALLGEYIVGTASGAKFNTLTAAVKALNALGVRGETTLLLDNTTYSRASNEIFPIVFNSYTGNQNYKVTIKPNTGKIVTIEGASEYWWNNNPAVFQLNGTDNVVFEGSNNNSTSQDLTIYNNNNITSSTKSVIQLSSDNANGASNNVFRNLIVKQYTKEGTYSYGIYSGGANLGDESNGANSKNTVQNITFTKVGQPVYVNSGSANLSTDWKILKNTIGAATDDSKAIVGIYLNNAKDYEISENSIIGVLKSNTSNPSAHSGIFINGTSNGTIAKNLISDINNSTANNYHCAGIYLNSGNNIVTNNYVTNIKGNRTGDNNSNFLYAGQGIYLKSGSNNKVYFNTVIMNTVGTNNICSAALYIENGTNIIVKNNIFYNSQSGRQYAINSGIAANQLTSDYNDLKSSTIGYFNSANRTSLQDWKTATSKDANSFEKTPVFIGTTLRLDPDNLDNKTLLGQQVTPAIDQDYYSTTRVKPVMGAEEIAICNTVGDQLASGNGEWIGYVYSNYTSNTVNPLASASNSNYRGYVTEDANFDREVANGSPFRGKDNYLCNAPIERYFVRYKMTLNLPAGKYNFTVGGDDGYRLSIDGTAVTAINNWGEHGYATNSTSITYNTTATHTFILEYFNGPNLAHVSFNYNKVEGDPTEFGNNVWNVYAYNQENIDIEATAASYAGYYVDPALGINSEDRWNNALSPSAAVAVQATGATGWMGGVVRNDNFTVVHKRKGFPCGLYDIVMNKWDDAVKVYLDGNLIFSNTGYAANANTLVANGPFKLNADSKMEVRLREGGGAANIKMTLTDRPSIYNGSWSAAPANTNITVNSDLVLNENLNVCSCTVNAGKKLTIAANATLNVDENVTVVNSGSILVKNTGSLVQIKDSATFTGESNSFTMERNTTPMINYDFSYWASPVATQNLKTFSPNTLADKYYSFNGASWVIENPVTTAMTVGRGYIVRAPQGWANTITNGGVSSYNTTQPNGTFEGGVFQGVFTGKANAGTITVPLMGNVGVNNLIGNPYASPISVEEFLNANAGKIDGTFYFWTHKTRVSQTPNSNGTYPYNNQDYAAYNRTGGIATSPIEKKPNGIIASGQGFFVRTIGTGNVVFKNSMRVQGINSNKDFYRTGETTTVENNRFWLSMGNVDGLYSEFLVGYNEEATNSFDVDYDGITTSTGNVMLYTVVDAKKLAIQGRQAPFDQSDVIPVGYKAAAAGLYTISINKKDGLFERNQAIYLYDYVTNEYHDLTAGDFTFTSAAGTFDTRFEVRFADRTLGVNNPVASTSDIIVYKNGNQIAAKANNFTIEDMQVYDITGKILFNKQGIDNNEFMTSSLNVANQVVVVKVTLDGGQIITKKVIMN